LGGSQSKATGFTGGYLLKKHVFKTASEWDKSNQK
jgi:hypothetical protein